MINCRLLFPLAALLLLPFAAFADAGKVLFVYGTAYVQAADGSRTEIDRGDAIQSGDLLVTSANGRVQLRMSDGGLLALRPQTEFLIENFNDPAENARTGRSVEDNSPRSFFALLKGGFRSITGSIGHERKSDYRVRTPVATIGIRGTDYTAVLCAGDCSALRRTGAKPISDGLYIGVAEGGIVLVNDSGTLNLGAGQFGFVAGEDSGPQESADAENVVAASTSLTSPEDAEPVALSSTDIQEAPATAEVPSTVTDASGAIVNLTGGNEPAATSSRAIAFAAGPLTTASGFSGAAAAGTAAVATGAAGNVSAFSGASPGGDARYEIGTSQAVNAGRDENRAGATGLQWGRWSTGDINVTTATSTTTQDLTNSSLHWVAGPEGVPSPTVPSQGTAQFSLVGNTNPTDNAGNVGTLGSASLVADFTAQTVDADVNVAISETSQLWSASAEDVSINSADATFGGEFDSVTVTDTVTSTSVDGNGTLDGFFSGNPAGAVTGAGLTYSLGDAAGTTVSGAAAFQVDDTN